MKVGDSLTVRLSKDDELIIELLSNQSNLSKSVKKILLTYAIEKGTSDISAIPKVLQLPQQKEITSSMLKILSKSEREFSLKELYELVASDLNISNEAQAMCSEKSGQNIYKNRLRWSREELKWKNYATFPNRGAIIITELGKQSINN